jgi:hypothetical protein
MSDEAILDYNSDHREAFEEGKAKGCEEEIKAGQKRLRLLT